jgi:hypothetical protein
MVAALHHIRKTTSVDRRPKEINEVDSLKKQFRTRRFNKIVNCCYQGVQYQLAQAAVGSRKDKLIALKVALAALMTSNGESRKNPHDDER